MARLLGYEQRQQSGVYQVSVVTLADFVCGLGIRPAHAMAFPASAQSLPSACSCSADESPVAIVLAGFLFLCDCFLQSWRIGPTTRQNFLIVSKIRG